MNRRHLLAASPALLLLGGCPAGTSQATTLQQAQLWTAALASALAAAAAAYTGPNAAQVAQIAGDLRTAAAAFQTLGDVATARSAALSVIALAQQLSPLVAPALGQAGQYVPVALAILSAFTAALPPPAGAPASPPAAMVAPAR
jgi:hypothetical protein